MGNEQGKKIRRKNTSYRFSNYQCYNIFVCKRNKKKENDGTKRKGKIKSMKDEGGEHRNPFPSVTWMGSTSTYVWYVCIWKTIEIIFYYYSSSSRAQFHFYGAYLKKHKSLFSIWKIFIILYSFDRFSRYSVFRKISFLSIIHLLGKMCTASETLMRRWVGGGPGVKVGCRCIDLQWCGN